MSVTLFWAFDPQTMIYVCECTRGHRCDQIGHYLNVYRMTYSSQEEEDVSVFCEDCHESGHATDFSLEYDHYYVLWQPASVTHDQLLAIELFVHALSRL